MSVSTIASVASRLFACLRASSVAAAARLDLPKSRGCDRSVRKVARDLALVDAGEVELREGEAKLRPVDPLLLDEHV